jgi:hypothetical protein
MSVSLFVTGGALTIVGAAIGIAILCVRYEQDRRLDAMRRGRVLSELPWQFVVLETIVAFVVEPLIGRVCGVPSVDEAILRARNEAQLYDFIDEAMVRARLAVHLAAINNRRTLLYVGRMQFSTIYHQSLVAQLHLAERRKRHQPPPPTALPLPRQLFIVGLPRSGTTRLFHLLSLDRRTESVPLWQLANPLPAPRQANYRDDPRADQLRNTIKWLPATRLRRAHQFGADVPEEDDFLLFHSMLTSFVDRYELEDRDALEQWHAQRSDPAVMRAAYAVHRTLIEAILENRSLSSDSLLLLKSTIHGAFLPYVVSQYPDAVFVQTHRKPFDSIVSMAYLRCCLCDTLAKSVDVHSIGQRVAQFEEWHMARLLAYRRSLTAAQDKRRFVDVHFDDIGADPIAVVEQIYSHFGIAMTDQHRVAMSEHLRAHPSSTTAGEFDVSMFGLDPEDVESRFEDYVQFAKDKLSHA